MFGGLKSGKRRIKKSVPAEESSVWERGGRASAAGALETGRERETQRRGRNSGVSGQGQAMGWGRHGRQEIAQEVLRE